MIEDLRQICIHKQAYEKDSQRQKWWSYVDSYHRFCYGSVNEDCSKIAHDMNFMEYETTMQCVYEAFNGGGKILGFKVDKEFKSKVLDSPDVQIDLLDEEKDYYTKYGPNIYPAVVINN